MPPTNNTSPASHGTSWFFAVLLSLLGLTVGGAIGYYLGVVQSTPIIQESVVNSQPASGASVGGDTSASSSNPLQDVKLNPFD